VSAPRWVEWEYVAVAVAVPGKLDTPRVRRITALARVNAAAPPRLTAKWPPGRAPVARDRRHDREGYDNLLRRTNHPRRPRVARDLDTRPR